MMTITEAIEDVCLEYESKNKSPKTIKSLQGRLSFFEKYMSDYHHLNTVHLLRTNHLQSYEHYLKGQTDKDGNPWSIAYMNVFLWALRAVLNHLKKYNHISLDLASMIEDLPTPDRFPKYVMEHDEVKLFLSQIDKGSELGYRDFVLFNIIANTGIRVEALSLLDINDVNLKEGTVFVRFCKFGKQQLLPLSPTCVELLRNYLNAVRPIWRRADETNSLFIGERGNRFSVKGIETAMKKYIKKAELNPKYTPHSIRKYVVTALCDASANPYHIKELMNWESLRPLGSYKKQNIDGVRKTLMDCHPMCKTRSVS
jgi:integrase/recombinase XerD